MDETDSVVESVGTSVLADNVKSVAAGAVGGVAAVLTGHPFDLVKVCMQSGQYSSMGAAVRSIVQHGPLGFYKGVMPPLVGVTPMFAVSFWGYDVGKKLVSSPANASGTPLSVQQISAAGFISAVPTTLIAAPFERVKIILQTQSAGEPKAMGYAVRKILRTGGLQSLFKGSLATLARDGPGSAVYFATYELVKKKLSPQDNSQLSLGAVSIAGGLSGMAMWLAVFPVDTIKTFMTNGANESLTFKSTVQTIYRAKGVAGFFPGLGPALLRSFPANAATFVGVELTHQLFTKF